MKLIKSALVVAVAVSAVLGMTGCAGSGEPATHNSSINTYTVEFPTGDTVDCLKFDASKSAGLICDWDNLNSKSGAEQDGSLKGSVESINGREVLCVAFDGAKEGALDCNIAASDR